MGSTGEFIALTDDERPRVVEAVIDEVAGSVRVYVGAGHYSTARTLDHVRHAERSGADGVMIINPHCLEPPVERVLNHVRTVREARRLPIIRYTIPISWAMSSTFGL